MKATYNNHVIEATRGLDGLWTVTIDGKPANVKPSRYKGAAINRAVKALREDEREQKIKDVKEIEKS